MNLVGLIANVGDSTDYAITRIKQLSKDENQFDGGQINASMALLDEA